MGHRLGGCRESIGPCLERGCRLDRRCGSRLMTLGTEVSLPWDPGWVCACRLGSSSHLRGNCVRMGCFLGDRRLRGNCARMGRCCRPRPRPRASSSTTATGTAVVIVHGHGRSHGRHRPRPRALLLKATATRRRIAYRPDRYRRPADSVPAGRYS